MSPFDQFRAAFKGDILTEEAPDYNQAIARWAANSERRAKYICFVKNTDDVALALKFAIANGLKIAIRGGGNDPGGSSSEEGGLIIDMSRYFNEVRIDPQAKLAYVGGGARGRDVDHAAYEHGLAAVCGTVNRVSASPLSYSTTCIDLFSKVGYTGFVEYGAFDCSEKPDILLASECPWVEVLVGSLQHTECLLTI